jgi:hypothetical protein
MTEKFRFIPGVFVFQRTCSDSKDKERPRGAYHGGGVTCAYTGRSNPAPRPTGDNGITTRNMEGRVTYLSVGAMRGQHTPRGRSMVPDMTGPVSTIAITITSHRNAADNYIRQRCAEEGP